MEHTEHMSATEARERVWKFYRLATGRSRLEDAAKRLQIDLLTAIKDEDLVIILAEELEVR